MDDSIYKTNTRRHCPPAGRGMGRAARWLRCLSLIILLSAVAAPCGAVLKEKDLGETLRILRSELEKTHGEMGEHQRRLSNVSVMMRERLFETMRRANQDALMLYSQKQDYVFDLTYACHEATKLYQEFRSQVMPFRQWARKSDNEVARYDSLIQSLQTMPTVLLDERANTDRKVCLAMACNIRTMVMENAQTLRDYMELCETSETRLKTLNDYAQKRYNDIQSNIFVNGGENYVHMLRNLGSNLTESRQTVEEKYQMDKRLRSQWDASVILALFGVILFYGVISVLLNQIVIRIIVTRLMRRGVFNDSVRQVFLSKRACIIMATTTVTFAVILNIVRLAMDQNFILMASNLMTEFAWLMSVILISILIRVDSTRTMHTFFIYAPLLFIGFLVIAFRIVLIPNALVNISFPPVLLLCLLWQWGVLRRYHHEVMKNDRFYATVTFLVIAAAVVSSWSGFTLLSVQLLIWWVMQLTCILSITCLQDWYTRYARRHDIDRKPITKTWSYYLFTKVVTPIAAVLSVLVSIYWAADVFNLTEMTRQVFVMKFIDSQNFVASISSISQVVILWFIFNYVNFLAKAFVRYHYDQIDHSTAESRSVMFVNVIQVVIYGAWFLVSLAVFHVSNSWIVVISGGLSTGIGFASKDILENIYYGVSLMAGRIKIGDIIVCDGTRGKVSSISYTSTMIEAVDGSVIAFTNSQLFTKNYKNLTRNHGHEVAVVEVGVAYGADIDRVRQLLTEAISALPCVDTRYKGHSVSVIVKELADSCVTLKIVCWVNVMSSAVDNGTILECVYNTLNENNIEIPFPQRDIHVKAE
ncbi:MAG: mechanosensitive ion channel family protein [Prevotella sp.]